MDKTEFCYRLQEAFTSLRERNFESIVTEYDTVLTGDIDYKHLYNLFMSEWDKNFRPMPCDLKPFIQRAKIYKTQELKGDAKDDLIKVAKWFNSEDYQYYHKMPPDYIRMAIKQHNFTDEMINQAMLSKECYET